MPSRTSSGSEVVAQRRTASLARYTDVNGRRHRIVRRGQLVLDLSTENMPRVVVELGEGEGDEQVTPVVFGQGREEGYVLRAARERGPVCRELCPDDVARRSRREAGSAQATGEEVRHARRAA